MMKNKIFASQKLFSMLQIIYRTYFIAKNTALLQLFIAI